MPKFHTLRRERLVEALRHLTPVMHRKLARLKSDAEALRRDPEMLWRQLVNCSATHGNARGWERLFVSGGLPAALKYGALRGQVPARRRLSIERALRTAAVRWAPRKSMWLANNYVRIEELGGVRRATRQVLELSGRQAKLDFVLKFDGIGPKYAFNLWMDLYDPDFRDCVAVDIRLGNVLGELGAGKSVRPQEYFRGLAREARLEPWELDRLLFWFTDYFLAAIRW
jgi:hypothetical protein